MDLNSVTWGEFKVEDVLLVEQTKSVIAKENLIDGDIPYVTRTVSNNGYMRYCGNIEKLNKGNCITIGAETGVAFYQPNDFVAGNKVYRLAKDSLSKKQYQFLASILNMQTKNYSYSNARVPEKIRQETIQLPITPSGTPDWQFMEDYITELEQERITELEQYLIATGLNDYELTENDKKVLEKECERKEFRVGDLFEKKTMKGYPKTKENLQENKDGYYVYGQNIRRQHPQKVLMDEIYLHKINPAHPILAYTSSVGEIGMIDESFYRSGDNGAFQGLFPKWENNRYEIQFILTVLRKYFINFGYSTSMANIIDLKFLLPIQTDLNGNAVIDIEYKYHPEGYTPDWQFMEDYIRVIEKITIADVVKFKDEVIAKARDCVSGN